MVSVRLSEKCYVIYQRGKNNFSVSRCKCPDGNMRTLQIYHCPCHVYNRDSN